ncbi:MAG: hypothetical protein RL499_62 [Actinomycetota bacterium]
MMTRRVVLEIVLILAITVGVAWLILGVFGLADSVDPVATLVDQTPRVLFGLLGIGLALFALFVTIGSISLRRRSRRARIVSHIVSLILAIVINVAALAVVTVAANGGGGDSWGMLVLAIAGAAAAALAVAGFVAILLVELLILRPRAGSTAVAEPDNTPA